MKKVLIGISIVSVLLIAIVSLFDIDLAIKIAGNAIIATVLIGIIVYMGRKFGGLR
jgi:hypothetical protein